MCAKNLCKCNYVLTLASVVSNKSNQKTLNMAPKPIRHTPTVARQHCLLNRSFKCILTACENVCCTYAIGKQLLSTNMHP